MNFLRFLAVASGLIGSVVFAIGLVLSLGGHIGPLQAAPLAGAAIPVAITTAAMPAASRAAAGLPEGTRSRGATIPRALAEQDIRRALARAESIHPLLYWNASRMRVLDRAEALIAGLPDQPTTMDVYVALSRVIGMLGDGHVSLSRPPATLEPGGEGDALTSYLQHGGRLLALKVRPATGGLAILRSVVDGVHDADLLTAINGQSAWGLFARAAELASGEGGFKENRLELEFAARLWDLGLQPPFELEGTFSGVRGATREVAGWSGMGGPAPAAAQPEDGVHLTRLAGGMMLLRLDRLTAPRPRFQARLGAVFTEIARDAPPGLILDLRQNGGGNAALDDDVLSYLTSKSYRVFARVLVRASPECRAFLPGTIAGNGPARAIQTMADGETKSWDVAVHAPLPASLRFDGPVAVLIGPGTFSAANALANAIGDFRLATLVGRDTAEIPNNYGNACPVPLPNTGMTLLVPSTYMVRANGDAGSREDVHPDIWSAPGAANEDPDVTTARAWIRGQWPARKSSLPPVIDR